MEYKLVSMTATYLKEGQNGEEHSIIHVHSEGGVPQLQFDGAGTTGEEIEGVLKRFNSLVVADNISVA